MDYESFVAYSCMAIVLLMVVLFLRWIAKDNREQKRRHEEFERRRIEIENAIRRGWEVKDVDANGFACTSSGGQGGTARRPKRQRPDWVRFIMDESLGTLWEKHKEKRRAEKARAEDPWSNWN